MNHTPEPWGVPADGDLLLSDADGNILITGGGHDDYGLIAYATSVDDARRIVACVNACAGVDTELLEAYPAPFSEMRQQRDQLLATLQRIADGQEMTGQFTHADTVLRYQKIARASIAAVKGHNA